MVSSLQKNWVLSDLLTYCKWPCNELPRDLPQSELAKSHQIHVTYQRTLAEPEFDSARALDGQSNLVYERDIDKGIALAIGYMWWHEQRGENEGTVMIALISRTRYSNK